MTRVAFILWLALLTARAATVVSGPFVETNGWIINLKASNAPTNGVFAWGFASNNVLTATQSVVMTLSAPGYTTNAVLTTNSWTIYGTKELRLPAPNQALKDVTASGADALIRFASSSFIHPGETVTFNVRSNWYNSNDAAAGLVLTNLSAQSYPEIIGKITHPYYDRITGNTFQLFVTAFHQYGTNEMPVAAVQFISQDNHGHIVTNTVSSMATNLDFVATMDASTFTQGDIITNDYVVFPFRGTNLLDSRTRAWDIRTPYWHWTEYLADQTNLYGSAIAVVNQSSPSGTPGVMEGPLNTNSPPAAYVSIAAASAAIAAFNNSNHGRNDCAGATIYVIGNFSWIGTGGSPPSTRGNAWLNVENYPGQTATLVDGTGSGFVNGLTKFTGITITSTDNSTFSSNSNLWFNVVDFNTANGALIVGTGLHYVTGCTVHQFTQGFAQSGAGNTTFAILDGIDILGPSTWLHPYFIRGVHTFSSAQINSIIQTSQTGLPFAALNPVIINNRFLNVDFDNGTLVSLFAGSLTCSNGMVFAQNTVEGINPYPAGQLVDLHSDGAINNVTNCMIWHNVIVGARCGMWYNKEGSVPWWSVMNSDRGNIYSRRGVKSENVAPTDPNRIGNWSVMWGVGAVGTVNVSQINSIEGGGQFLCNFVGLHSYQPTLTSVSPEGGTPNPVGWISFVNDGSSDWTSTGTGNGNYHLSTNSPMANLSSYPMIKYDQTGALRTSSDPPGVFAGTSSPSLPAAPVGLRASVNRRFWP